MPESTEKERILQEAGYHYHFERSLYFNREQHKIFSVEAIDDHDIAWLQERIGEPNPGSEWLFSFNSAPSEETKRSILQVFQ